MRPTIITSTALLALLPISCSPISQAQFATPAVHTVFTNEALPQTQDLPRMRKDPKWVLNSPTEYRHLMQSEEKAVYQLVYQIHDTRIPFSTRQQWAREYSDETHSFNCNHFHDQHECRLIGQYPWEAPRED